MKRIGIITHYYNSCNYGGLLQSYALMSTLNNRGFETTLIQYNSIAFKGNVVKRFARKILGLFLNVKSKKMVRIRTDCCSKYRNAIKHSKKVYNNKNINNASSLYDAFIVGSDQVWHPSLFDNGYSLNFTKKQKFSYAASMAVDTINESNKKVFEEALNSYTLISVRERKAQELLDFNKNIQLVLDPVFLLSDITYRNIATPRMIEERYIFTYFLGDSVSSREEAIRYAKQRNLKIVNIPYLNGTYRKCDKNFGDYKLCKISPNDFLSLIIHSECILTDSFHAICFSFIFKKNFYVFKRNANGSMNSRIDDILLTLDLKDRYVTKIEDFKSIDYSAERPIFNELLNKSYVYIKKICDCINGDQDA